jgi:hypothetical protein
VVLGGHEEVTRLGRVVRSLFGDVVSTRVVWVVPVSGKGLAEDGVERLLDTAVSVLAAAQWTMAIRGTNSRRFDMPSTKIEFGDGDKALDGVIDGG